jgi:hypothetical protein
VSARARLLLADLERSTHLLRQLLVYCRDREWREQIAARIAANELTARRVRG